MAEKNNQKVIKDRKEAIKALEVLFAADFIDKKKLYIENFIRGIALGAGTVIGATVLVTLVLWVLSLFDTVPLIGPLFDSTGETIKQNR